MKKPRINPLLGRFIFTGLVLFFIVFIILLSLEGYKYTQTGFQTRTLWDWMTLLIVPAGIALGGFGFSWLQNLKTQALADDAARESALQGYLDNMSDLLVNHKLRESAIGDEKRNIARIQTMITLNRLDHNRRRFVIRFLREAGLIGIKLSDNIISFRDIDLRSADFATQDLSFSNLAEVFFMSANLEACNLTSSRLEGARLDNARLKSANLQSANLSTAKLTFSNLQLTNLRLANMRRCILDRADLRKSDLSTAYLEDANLRDAKLGNANLRNANLSNADLRGADLRGADLNGAILDGAKYDHRTKFSNPAPNTTNMVFVHDDQNN